MMKKLLLPLTLALAASLSMTACGAANKSTSTVMETAAAPSVNADMASGRNDVTDDRNYESSGQSAAPGSYGESPAAGIMSESVQMAVVPNDRKLIRTVSIQVETDTFDTLLSEITARLAALGGYIEYSDVSGTSLNYYGDPIPKHASLTVRVPDGKLPDFITTVESSGNVTNKTESTEDVTLKYSDVESRKKSLEIEQERIWQFLEKAETIDTVITLEQRLSDIRYELESMESQLRLYDNQTSYSTVNLSIGEVTEFTSTAPRPVSISGRITDGLANNFTAVVTALTNLLVALITTSPIWVPLLLIALIIWRIARKHPKKVKHPESPAYAPAQRQDFPPDGASADESSTDQNSDTN